MCERERERGRDLNLGEKVPTNIGRFGPTERERETCVNAHSSLCKLCMHVPDRRMDWLRLLGEGDRMRERGRE